MIEKGGGEPVVEDLPPPAVVTETMVETSWLDARRGPRPHSARALAAADSLAQAPPQPHGYGRALHPRGALPGSDTCRASFRLTTIRVINQENGFHPPMLTRVHIFDDEGNLSRPFVYGISCDKPYSQRLRRVRRGQEREISDKIFRARRRLPHPLGDPVEHTSFWRGRSGPRLPVRDRHFRAGYFLKDYVRLTDFAIRRA